MQKFIGTQLITIYTSPGRFQVLERFAKWKMRNTVIERNDTQYFKANVLAWKEKLVAVCWVNVQLITTINNVIALCCDEKLTDNSRTAGDAGDSLSTSEWKRKRLAFATQSAWCNHVTVIENDRSGRWPTAQHCHTWRPVRAARAGSVWHRNNLMASLSCRHAGMSATAWTQHKLTLATVTSAADKTARVTRRDLRRRSGICESDVRQRLPRGGQARRLAEPIKFWRAKTNDVVDWRRHESTLRRRHRRPYDVRVTNVMSMCVDNLSNTWPHRHVCLSGSRWLTPTERAAPESLTASAAFTVLQVWTDNN